MSNIKLTIALYSVTATLVVLKLLSELDWSWWNILFVLAIYESIGFVSSFIAAFKSRNNS